MTTVHHVKLKRQTFKRLSALRKFLESRPTGQRTAAQANFQYVLKARVTYDDVVRILLDNVKVNA